MEKRPLVSVGADGLKELARGNDAVLVGELKDCKVFVLELDVSRTRCPVAVALILSTASSLRQGLSAFAG